MKCIKIQRYHVIPVICMIVVIILTLNVPHESYPPSLVDILNTDTPSTKNNSNNGDNRLSNRSSCRLPEYYYGNSPIYTGHKYRYNNAHTRLMSYYPASIHPGESRNGLYTYPHREDKRGNNNNNNDNKNILYDTFIKESSVERINTLPHPSCIADVLIRNYVLEYGNNDTNNNNDDVNQWKKYITTEEHCLKKDYTRRRGDDVETAKEKKITPPFSHIILRNVMYSMGEFFYVETSSQNNKDEINNNTNNTEKADNQYITFTHDATFSTVKGDWPQQVMETITLRRIILKKEQLNHINDNHLSMKTAVAELRRLIRRKGLDNPHESNNNIKSIIIDKNTTENNHDDEREGYTKSIFKIKTQTEKELSSPKQPLHLHVPIAYWQPPTDFNSQYHTLLETVAPAMHSLITAMKSSSLSKELFYMDSSSQRNGDVINNRNEYSKHNINDNSSLLSSLNHGSYHGKGNNGDMSSKDGESNSKRYYPTGNHEAGAGDSHHNNYSVFNNINNCDGRIPDSGGPLLLPATLLITSRVRRVFPNILNMKIVETSCATVPNTPENPDLLSPIDNNKSNKNCINSPLGRMEQAVVGTAGVYGLQSDHAQIYLGTNIGDKNLRNPWKKEHNYAKADLPNTEIRGHDDILFIDRLLVGNPTHCENTGGGAFSAEAVAQDQFIHGKKNTSRINLGPRRGNNNASSSNYSFSQEEILREKRIKQFFEVYRECQLFIWEFRNFFLNKIAVGGRMYSNDEVPIAGDIKKGFDPETFINKEKQLIETARVESSNDASLKNSSLDNNSSKANISALHREIRMLPLIPALYADSVTPININNTGNDSRQYGDGIHILIASRKGDWAREFNEDEVAFKIRAHFKKKAEDLLLKNLQEEKSWNNSNGDKSQEQKQLKELSIALQAIYESATVRLVKFTGKKGLNDKLLSQLDVPKTTIFIGNHGANLIPIVYLRPNSGVITLSLIDPPFYPFGVFPRWLHWRDIVINQKCNKRLFKGCKMSNKNNNDMHASKKQINRVLEYLDDIITEQIERPRKFSVG